MKEILKYQEIDLEIKRIEAEILGCEARKKASEMQNMLRTLQERLQKLEEQAKGVNEKLAKIESSVADGAKKFEQIQKKSTSVVGKEADELAENAKSMQNILSVLGKEAGSIQRQAEDLSKELETVMKNAKIAKSNLMVYRDQYDKLRTSKEKELNALRAKLQEQEKLVDKKLLAKYQTKQTGRNTKVFVPLTNGCCGGCRMQLASNGIAKLEKDKYMECENCGRIIYID